MSNEFLDRDPSGDSRSGPEPDERTDLLARQASVTISTPAVDALLRLAAHVMDMPLALLSPVSAPGQSRRLASLYDHTLLQPGRLLVIEDTSFGDRFPPGPPVGEMPGQPVDEPPVIGFYAGVSVAGPDGHPSAILCVLDVEPRQISAYDCHTLLALATSAAAMLALRQGEEDLRNARDLNPHYSWTADRLGNLENLTPRVFTLTGVLPEALLGDGYARVVHPDDMATAGALWMQSVQTGVIYDVEQRVRIADGTYRWCRVYAAPRRDHTGAIVRWYGTTEDIEDRRTSQAQVDYLAFHDGLTGLTNRVHFRQLLEQEIARVGRGTSFALVRLDIDDFKAVNDTLGHLAGDELLVQAANRLGACARQTDILARNGDDEFFIVLTDLHQPEDATLLAERILRVLATPMKLDGTVFTVGASIGITLCPQDGTHPDKLLQNSDLALDRAKAEARGGYRFFETAMDEKLRLHQAIKIELRDAIDRNEFELVYQPLISLPGGQVDGFEALLRWRHPTRGYVSPVEFIPAAEQTGLILPLGRWVLEQACRDAMGWPAHIRVAVNLSVVQFRQRTLTQSVAAALAASGLSPARLELEITESVPLLDDQTNIVALRRLRDLGIRIVLDDFGTGYASLSYLQRFPFDKLKIDRSFITRMTSTPGAQTIVNAVLRMAHALGIATTAEGVETRQQLDILMREGCNELQGFFFSRPVPASGVPATIALLADRWRRESWSLAEQAPRS